MPESNSNLQGAPLAGKPPGAEAPRGRGAFLALVAAALAAGASLAVGLLLDDLKLARLAAHASWEEVFTLRAGPFFFHVTLWKLAGLLSPSEPQRVVHLVAALLHGGCTFLVARLLARWCRPATALAGAAAFALFRPASEAVLWAAADAELFLTFFSLLALYFWTQGSGRPRLRWAAVGSVALALLGKPSACLLPVVLAFSALWLEDRREGPWRERLAPAGGPLLAAVAVSLVLAANAFYRPGPWAVEGYFALRPGPWQMGAALGNALARLALLVSPTHWVAPLASGYATLLLAALVVLLPRCDARVRLGVLWAGALLSPSVMMAGLPQGRYLYAGAFGAILAGCALWERLAARLPRARALVLSLALLWMGASAALWARDAFKLAGCGRVSQEVRSLLAAHAGEVRRAGRLVMVRRTRLVRPSDSLAYDWDLVVPMPEADRCPAGAPCLEFARPVSEARACPGPGERPFVRWVPAHEGNPGEWMR